MSVMILPHKHIRFLVQSRFILRHQQIAGQDADINQALADSIGQEIWDANVSAFRERYSSHSDNPEVGDFAYHHKFKTCGPGWDVNPVQVLAAIVCYEYQVDGEWTMYQGSPAQTQIESIKGWAIRGLPGFDSAGWCIEDSHHLFDPNTHQIIGDPAGGGGYFSSEWRSNVQ